MKGFLPTLSITLLFLGVGMNPAFANDTVNEQVSPKLPYDQCGEGTSAFLQEFPSIKTFKKFYPTVLAKGNSPKPPFYGKGFFNLACGGTALSGVVIINKANQVTVETCGDLAVQTKEEACSTLYKGKYKNLYSKGNGFILKNDKIFMVEKNQITVTNFYKDE